MPSFPARPLRVALVCGDPNGIGPEVVLKTALQDGLPGGVRVVLFGPHRIWAAAAGLLGVAVPPELDALPDPTDPAPALPTVSSFDPDGSRAPAIRPGRLSAAAARAACAALLGAASAAMNRQVDAIVTAPVSGEAFRLAGLRDAGQTALLARLVGARHWAELFLGGRLPVVLPGESRFLRSPTGEIFDLLAEALPLLNDTRPLVARSRDQAIALLDIPPTAPAFAWTLGLSVLRAAPVHGPAFDIAWQNRASPASTLAALRWVARLAASPNLRPFSTPTLPPLQPQSTAIDCPRLP